MYLAYLHLRKVLLGTFVHIQDQLVKHSKTMFGRGFLESAGRLVYEDQIKNNRYMTYLKYNIKHPVCVIHLKLESFARRVTWFIAIL